MTFKTLMLQLYRPSRQKRRFIDTALLHYSQALQFLMDRYRAEIEALSESETHVTQRQILKIIDKETAESLNRFDVQPFKDSLKLEFAAISASYLARKRNNSNTGYPLVFLDASRYTLAVSDCIGQFDSGEIGSQRFESRCSRLTGQAGKLRSLYFGRYAMNRDYCLLYDAFKDRFYVKLYLLNRKNSVSGGYCASGLSLNYVWAGAPSVNNRPGPRRYLILPLAFGKKQYAALKEALQNPGLLHSARLVKKENQYYLMLNMECQRGTMQEAVTTMGIARSACGGLCYTVCDKSGAITESSRISAPRSDTFLLNFANRIAEIAERNRSQVILGANGSKNDRMPAAGRNPALCFSVRQYALLAKSLNYKLPGKGLPPPIEVSANGLFLTCPRCGTRTRRNRVSDELFACIHCGYASESEWIGSETLAKKLDRYRADKVPITVLKKSDCVVCRNKMLGFEAVLPPGTTDYAPMFEALRRLLKEMEGTFVSDSKKYAVWKKLSQAPNLQEAVRFILR